MKYIFKGHQALICRGVLLALICLVCACRKNDTHKEDLCAGISNESPPRKIGLVLLDRTTGENLLLRKGTGAADIQVTDGETGEPFTGWHLLSGQTGNAPNGSLALTFFNDSPGEYTWRVEVKAVGTVNLHYAISRETSAQACRLFIYPMTGLQITDHPWAVFSDAGKTYPGVLAAML